MKILITTAKSMVLMVLIFISFVQIGELWFEGHSNRNSFYNVLPTIINKNKGDIRDTVHLLQPSQVAVYYGDNGIEYTVIRQGANAYSNVTDSVAEIISSTLKLNNYTGVLSEVDELWQEQHMMIKLPIPIERALLEESLGLSKNALDSFDSVKTIIIVPAKDNDQSIRVYVEDEATKVYHEYEQQLSNVEIENEWLNFFIDDYPDTNQSNYVSTLKNKIRFYNDNILLPSPSEGIRYQSQLELYIPFLNNNKLDDDEVKDYVAHFFDNPSTISTFEIEGGIYYRELESSVVKYLRSGLVDYYRSGIDKPSYVDIPIAISAATQFLEADMKALPAEYYLREVEVVDKEVRLYYDFGYNEFPIIISDTIMETYELDKPYPIRIVVAEDEVVGYKRVLRGIDEMVPQNKIFTAEYEVALDHLVEAVGNIDVMLEDTYLGYVWSEMDKGMKLHWIMKTEDGQMYYFPVDG